MTVTLSPGRKRVGFEPGLLSAGGGGLPHASPQWQPGKFCSVHCLASVTLLQLKSLTFLQPEVAHEHPLPESAAQLVESGASPQLGSLLPAFTPHVAAVALHPS